jgi:hypothetical protein
MKNSIFWDLTSYRPPKANQHFGEIHRLHLADKKAKNESRMKPTISF